MQKKKKEEEEEEEEGRGRGRGRKTPFNQYKDSKIFRNPSVVAYLLLNVIIVEAARLFPQL
jgi:hypothetical protein